MDHTITLDALAVHEVRLAPNVETVITVELPSLYNQDLELLNLDGRARVYFTLDDTPAVVAGPRSYVLPAAMTSVALTLSNTRNRPRSLVVRLISAGDPLISLTREFALDENSPLT